MTPCPNDDVLGALVQRSLDEAEAAAVTSHLDECAGCRQIVIAAVRGGLAAVAPPAAAAVPRAMLAELGALPSPALGSSPPGAAALGTPTTDFLDTGGGRAAVAAPAASGPFVGEAVGRYQLRGLLGAGGMGRVFEAFDPELDRSIALKVMRPELTKLSGLLAERLVRESRLTAKVVHPAVISVHDVGRAGDTVFIAMELIRGETLGAYVRRARPTWRQIVELLVRAGQGLAAAHARGVIHRDFKPDNILVELDAAGGPGRVVVTDFGVARVFADELVPPTDPGVGIAEGTLVDPALTATGTAIGTPAYMAPEQLDGRPVDPRVDVFAFAVTAWELLLGARPFAGRTAAELRAALEDPPVAPRGHAVPARIVRALARGLAQEPADRWPDIPSLLRALSPRARPRRARIAIAAGAAAALVGAGLLAAHLFSDEPEDPCASRLAAFDALYPRARAIELQTALAAQPGHAKFFEKLDRSVAAWRAAHTATCSPAAAPSQPVKTAACLDARALEISGVIDDVLSDGALGARYAARLAGFIGKPEACRDPAPGLLAARVPADPALRRRVTAVRYRLVDAEDARDQGDHRRAIETAREAAAELAALWEPAQAEALYVLGTAESYGGDNKQGMAKLREAAALAARVHNDPIAANIWLQLAMTTGFDDGDPVRGLEYVAQAAAAIERIGHPPDAVVMLEYTHGALLIEVDRSGEAEPRMRRALELAEQHAPEHIPEMIQGVGLVLEAQGKFGDAIAAYQRALAKLAARGPLVPATDVIIRGRLATMLANVGRVDEAEVEVRKTVEASERSMSEQSIDRWAARIHLAQILSQRGKLDAALAEARTAAAAIGRILGERSERYGEALNLVAEVLVDRGEYAEAVKTFARACDVIAFGIGEGTSRQAECWLGEIGALSGLDRHAEALALADRALPILEQAYGADHPQVATAIGWRGHLRVELGRPGGLADLERSLSLFEAHPLDPGHLAGIRFSLGRALWRTDRTRSRSLVEQAAEGFKTAGGNWAITRRDAEAWLASHPAR